MLEKSLSRIDRIDKVAQTLSFSLSSSLFSSKTQNATNYLLFSSLLFSLFLSLSLSLNSFSLLYLFSHLFLFSFLRLGALFLETETGPAEKPRPKEKEKKGPGLRVAWSAIAKALREACRDLQVDLVAAKPCRQLGSIVESVEL